MAEWRIELENVRKSYGAKPAVHNLSLQVAAGEIFAFLGPNGAGKTTTIKMLTGLLRPDAGRIAVAGCDMASRGAEARRRISFVPDTPYLYEKLTGREFLRFVRDLYGMDGPEVERRQDDLVARYEIGGYVDNLAETYSHGMRQRLAFVAAFLHAPQVLVLDEPMVGLDPKSMRVVKDHLVAEARGGLTVFMSTHTLAIAEEVATRVGILHRGRLARCGPPAELRDASGQTGSTLEDYFLQVTQEGGGPT